MATVSMIISKETFIPEKNYFKGEDVQVSREETSKEIELWNNMVNWSNRGFTAIGLGIGLCLLLCLGCACFCSSDNPWAYVGFAAGVVSFIGCLIFANVVCWPKEQEWADIRRKWHDEHDEELWAEAIRPIKEYNEEQKRIAEAWRAKHPFEEKIRSCLRDPSSSVDIANLARYYAEVYIKEKENEQ